MKWIQVHSSRPEGHALFLARGHVGLCVADNSGETPDDTDDGPLWIDADRLPGTLVLERHGGTYHSASVPVEGGRFVSLIHRDALFVAREYNLSVSVKISGLDYPIMLEV